jgi:hypothetical protein
MYRYRTASLNGNNGERSTQTIQTSKLLTLPRELRDEILSYLLETRTEPPKYAPCDGRRHKLHHFHYPPYRHYRFPPLSWVCRQLRNECFDLVSKRVSGGQLTAELDIIFKGYLSWLTWTYLPPLLPRERPFDLAIKLRIFSAEAFRSNDGWPRQPGTAFRDLLWMLNSLLHNGPSLTSNQDNKGLYRINTLSVDISFHDDYTPDTHPEAAHNIFRMLKELATVGLTNNIVRRVQAHTKYVHRGETKVYDGQWGTPEYSDPDSVQKWKDMGFFGPAQLYSRSLNPTSHSP